MKKITVADQHRTGVFPEHRGKQIKQAPHENVRLTIPARKALEQAGAIVTLEPQHAIIDTPTYTVQLIERAPKGLIAAHTKFVCHPWGPDKTAAHQEVLSLRMTNEPEYPGEYYGDYWSRLDFVPCPKCGAPLIWYEAGYVPGYRVCARKPHHHMLAGGR